jgi:hypothetical protein
MWVVLSRFAVGRGFRYGVGFPIRLWISRRDGDIWGGETRKSRRCGGTSEVKSSGKDIAAFGLTQLRPGGYVTTARNSQLSMVFSNSWNVIAHAILYLSSPSDSCNLAMIR